MWFSQKNVANVVWDEKENNICGYSLVCHFSFQSLIKIKNKIVENGSYY